ncbi:hypothetical protein ACFWF7_20550 [Nocardia sp. NPDC060256]|uniref:hypothetical protein n=1 Tax=unclassified Nocardia TaxID=2637762 RepID=UPI003669DEB3
MRKEDHRLDTPEALARLSSAGRPLFHVDISIQDDADRHLPVGEVVEICARQPGRMSGYLDAGKDKGSVWAPKTLDFVEALPLNPSGKVDKKALRAPYWAGRARQVN